MQSIDIAALVARWVHALAFVVAIGGAFFMRFVLLPSAGEALAEDAQARLRETLLTRWKRIVHACIGLLLLSGGYNFYRALSDHVAAVPYHPIFTVKVLLALGVFVLAIGLTSTKTWAEPLRRERKKWLSVLIALAVVVVLLSGVLKQVHVTAK